MMDWAERLLVATKEIERLEAENKRLREALDDVAEMTEHEASRTCIYNHCKQSIEAAGGE